MKIGIQPFSVALNQVAFNNSDNTNGVAYKPIEKKMYSTDAERSSDSTLWNSINSQRASLESNIRSMQLEEGIPGDYTYYSQSLKQIEDLNNMGKYEDAQTELNRLIGIINQVQNEFFD